MSRKHTPNRTDTHTLLGVMLCGLFALFALPPAPGAAERAERQHGIAMHGKPALAPGFPHLDYVNPEAPKGGRITLGVLGTYDSLNPLIIRGVAPPDIRGLVYESLLARNAAEPFSLYGLVAQTISVPDDRSSITFHLDPRARFSDGKQITADDVFFSWELLKAKGRPYMRSYYVKVTQAEIIDPSTIRFEFANGPDREIPLILGLMPILPKHAIDIETFDRPTLDPPLGSGPYVIDNVEAGKSFTYRRNPDYWAHDLPIRRGLFNADELRMLYFNDGTALFEALKSGKLDYRNERDPGRWLTGYDFPAVRDGRLRKYTFETNQPAGMTGFVFNMRRAKFSNPKVRKALLLAFDSRRVNKQLFHDLFARTQSFFARSPLASTGHPASAKENALLAPYLDHVKPSIIAGDWRIPETGDDPGNRQNLRRAFNLLQSAGYRLANSSLVDASGEPLAIEFLVTSRAQARIAVDFAENLKRLGIKASIRQVDDSQYWSRTKSFDFDIIQWTYNASLSPGNEQIHRWTSTYADVEGSLNFAGVKNPAVDAMVQAMLETDSRDDFEAAVRAFDRVLLSGDYILPLFHPPGIWIAASDRLAFPKTKAEFGTDISMWWVKPGR
jgi:peptide/nickel transport system substrate-binding protein